MITRFDAIHSLVGGSISGSEAEVFYNDGQTPPTDKAIDDELKRLQAEYDAKKYQRDRAVAYDPIPEQLDQIYWDMDGWKKRIKAVKDKFPKP